MFGSPIAPLGRPPAARCYPRDRAVLGSKPGEWGVLDRRAGSDWSSRAVQHQQRHDADERRRLERGAGEQLMMHIRNDWDEGCERRAMVARVKQKVDLGMQCYEQDLAERREKIRALYLAEEAAVAKEMANKSLHLLDNRQQEMKQQAEDMRNKKETERLALVEQKRLQQYRDRCEALRPLMAQQNLRESKEAQLYQIKEKELLQAREREVDNMWTAVMHKDIEAKKEREMYEAKERYSKDREDLETLRLQIAGVEAQRKEVEAIKHEEKLETDRLVEQLRQEAITELQDKVRRRDEAAEELRAQIATRESFLAQRKREEYAIDNTFTRLAQAELDRERAAISDSTERLKREVKAYRDNLEELRLERLAENKELDRLLAEEAKIAEDKRDAARRVIAEARRKLLVETVCGRRDQLEEQRMRQVKEAQARADEHELAERMRTANQQLDAAARREQVRQRQFYRDSLLQQIEYANLIKKREKDELDRQFLEGQMEEERYMRLVQELLANPPETNPHPFKAVLGACIEPQTVQKCPCSPEQGRPIL